MRGDTQRRQRREHIQLALLWLFGAGSLAVPALHAVDHHGDHLHIGGATVSIESRQAPDAPTPADSDDPNHAGGSLAHLTLAYAAAPTFVVPAPPAEPTLRQRWTLPPAPAQPSLRTHQARAPPRS